MWGWEKILGDGFNENKKSKVRWGVNKKERVKLRYSFLG
jgi:hypothetical protein